MLDKFYLVSFGNKRVICNASGREDAKRKAFKWLGSGDYDGPVTVGDPDHYTVSPLTEDGDCVHIDVTVAV